MIKFFKFLVWSVFGLVAVAAIALFVFIKTFDLNKYKSYAEKAVYEQTGRKLSLNGDAWLKISLVPTAVLNDVSLSNPSWAPTPDMVKAKSVEVSVSILPLLNKEIVIDTVRLVEPEVYLYVSPTGENNWTFEKPGVQTAQAAPLTVTDAAPEVSAPLNLVAKEVDISDGIVIYHDLRSSSKTDVRVQSFALTAEDMASDVDIVADLLFNGEQINATATTGSIQSLLRDEPNFPVQVKVKAYGATADADMKLSGLLSGNISFAGNVNAQNPAGNFGAPDVNLQTALSGNVKNIVAEIQKLSVGGNTITGTVKADLSGSKPYVNAVLKSPKIDIAKLSAPVKKAQVSLVSTADAANFVPATPVDLSALKLVNADAKINVTTMVVNQDITLNNVSLSAKLNNGVLNVNPLNANLGGGALNANATVNANQNAFSLNAKGQNIVLQSLVPNLGVTDDKHFGIGSGGKMDLSLNLQGAGKTVRQIVESLNGQVIGIVGESRIQTGSLKYLEGSIVSQILRTLNIKTKEKVMKLQCAVARADIKDGNATFPKGIVFNAKDLTVVGDGSVNLKNDKINLTIHPFNGKLADTNVVQAISSLLKVSGTIDSPRLALDNSAVIKNVVGVAAAGPAFLGSQLLLDVDESPCYTALKGTAYQSMFPAPKGVQSAGQTAYQGASDAISGGVNLITDTAKGVLGILSGKKK